MSSGPLVDNSLQTANPSRVAPTDAPPFEPTAGSESTGFFRVQRILDRARALKGVLRLKPFDTSTAEGRSRERYRRAVLTTLTSVLAKEVTVLTALITVRLAVRYLGTERYGLWMTITSGMAIIMPSDQGALP